MGLKEYFASLPLPDSAMKIGDMYLEEEIIGYRTNSVKGRETMDVDITEISVGKSDGSTYRYKKEQTRSLAISFILIADATSEYQDLARKFKQVLSKEEQHFIFRDEPEVYYIGTVESIDAEPIIYMEGVGCAGTINIHCSDPHKYAVQETTVYATLDNGYTFGVDYKGTYPTKPKFEVTMSGDNGYVGFLDQNGHILEFGNVDEADGENKQRNERLVQLSDFKNAKDDVGGYDIMHPKYGSNGELGTGRISTGGHTDDYLILRNSGRPYNTAGGGLRTIEIPVDSQGEKGAKNWYSYFHLIFYAGAMGQTGEMSIAFCTEDNKLIAGCNWFKTDKTGNSGCYQFITYQNPDPGSPLMPWKVLKTWYYTTSHIHSQNPWYSDWGHCDLRKEGSKLTFFYYGSYYPYTIPEIENMVCTKIQIAIKEYDNHSMLYYYGFNAMSFDKLNVNYWVDSTNLFAKGDKLEVDVNTMEVTLNGMDKSSIGKIGNDWDNFKLQPGVNQIKAVLSSWNTTPPTLKMTYREAFL